MFGPRAKGFWTSSRAPNCGSDYGALVAGRQYKVIKAFTDYDGDVHPVGESWVYLGFSFLPYDSGLSLFVSLDGRQEWMLPMQLIPEEQEAVVHALEEHVAPA
ncbi:hypothetical protein CAI21_15925 [Alkalilimnicola ehrlichii]|uniref:DUF3601 domain-containing protein n=1 Tax=Alkalilimnicola ehrlichii TaxID=351052 RepID=UPI000E3ABF59|nr:DUF3601 domain-containing protein [Alkalilimnicola ehrlichii]RFA27035.1 hypothetical protein CAI21_15925 [Alkalilimnicola ehrlichii]